MKNINLLAIKIFNWTFDWTMEEALFWLLVAQVVLILFLVLVFAILMRRVGKVRAKDRSFMARYIQSEEDIKEWYISLKNEILSYKKVKARISWKKETFRLGRNVLARFSFRGKTLCLYLALNPADYVDSKYKVEDVKDQISYVDTPCMYRLKNERRVKYAMELIKEIMDKNNVIREERPFEEYYLPYEGTVELINKGLIKRVIKRNEESKVSNVDNLTQVEKSLDNATEESSIVNEEAKASNNNDVYVKEEVTDYNYEENKEEIDNVTKEDATDYEVNLEKEVVDEKHNEDDLSNPNSSFDGSNH